MTNRYYVYKHTDPDHNYEVVYVGCGSGGRAWLVGSSHAPLRDKKHCEWADQLLDRGITPDEFVEITDRGLSKEEALEIERILIHELKPRFNKSIRSVGLKLTSDLLEKAVVLRENGWSYQRIAEELELATMTIHRGMSGKTISLETALADQQSI